MSDFTENDKPNLIGVLFPGIVKNEEKAIQCLGGISSISEVYSHTNKKLGLSYHPENPFVKKIYGDIRKTAGVLIKVKVKKTKIDNLVKKEVISTTVVGCVNKMFTFESMGDFQYLPIHADANGTHQCFAEQILPKELTSVDFMQGPCPTYVVPTHFTRAEKPYNYAYSEKKTTDKVEEPEKEKDLHIHRKSRSQPNSRYLFGLTNELPSEPHENILKRCKNRLKAKPELEKEKEIVRKMFDERPVWSSKLIRYHTKFKEMSLKIYLPCLAVYMHDGPWKKMWIKFGYDPRKIPEARMYQALDVRVRHSGGMNSMVTKRDDLRQSKKSRSRRCDKSIFDEMANSEEVDEGAVIFRPGVAPTQRQLYYQYCDIHLPEVQEILAKEPPAGYLCHQTHGWLLPKTDQICRDYIFKYMKEAIFSSNADLKLEQGGSSEDESGSNSDDADDDAVPSTSTAGDDTNE